VNTKTPIFYVSPELEELRQLVAGARARLASLETDYTKEKSRVDVVQAVLFRLLREHYQKRDRLRLTVDYRQKFLDSFIRDNTDEAEQAENDLDQAKAKLDEDYEELAAAADKKKQLTAEQEAELTQLWKKLVKLYHPDRFANQPDKQETYNKLTAAINQAKDNGDIETLCEIAEDPEGFLFRKGWATLDFSDKAELTQLRRFGKVEAPRQGQLVYEARLVSDARYRPCQNDSLDEFLLER
jgi:DNA polymerase-3 subunit epsilon